MENLSPDIGTERSKKGDEVRNGPSELESGMLILMNSKQVLEGAPMQSSILLGRSWGGGARKWNESREIIEGKKMFCQAMRILVVGN